MDLATYARLVYDLRMAQERFSLARRGPDLLAEIRRLADLVDIATMDILDPPQAAPEKVAGKHESGSGV